jgi:hypothetical protein
MSTAVKSPPVADRVPLAEIMRVTGRTASACKTLAAVGAIRTFALPGCRVLYSRADAERLIRQQPASPSA